MGSHWFFSTSLCDLFRKYYIGGGGGGEGKERTGVLQNNLVLSTESVMLAPVNSF